MQVRATKCGYLGHYREEGEEFEIASDQEFSGAWMEKVDDTTDSETSQKMDAKSIVDSNGDAYDIPMGKGHKNSKSNRRGSSLDASVL